MEPGPELDAIIAEKVMGCKLWRRSEALMAAKDQTEYESLRRRAEYECTCPDSAHTDCDDEGMYSWLKEYSTDIAAAWEVVERMQKPDKGFAFQLWFSEQNDTNDQWYAHFTMKHWLDNGYRADGVSKSAPHAICLATLETYDRILKQYGHKLA